MGDSTGIEYLDKTVKRQSVRPFLSHTDRQGEISPFGSSGQPTGPGKDNQSIGVWVRLPGTLYDTRISVNSLCLSNADQPGTTDTDIFTIGVDDLRQSIFRECFFKCCHRMLGFHRDRNPVR